MIPIEEVERLTSKVEEEMSGGRDFKPAARKVLLKNRIGTAWPPYYEAIWNEHVCRLRAERAAERIRKAKQAMLMRDAERHERQILYSNPDP